MTLPLFDIPPAVWPSTDPAPVPTPARTLVFESRVYGIPGPQGSKKGFYNKATGRVQMVESSAKVKPWRDDVRKAALDLLDGVDTLNCPVIAEMIFTAVRPKGHYRTGRNAHLLRDNAPIRPATKPDVSKLARSTEDALTSAGVYRDDALIVEYTRLAKVYAGEDHDALDKPGAVIRLYTIGAAA
jgi:Holliday junction resolvase RusA-like endonuclease